LKRVLITGGTGFVGSHTVDAYLNAGWTVRAFVRNRNRLTWLQDPSIEITVGTMTDRDSLRRAVEDCQTVVHCAGMTKALRTEDLFRVNGDATGKLTEAAREAGVERFIYCSSQAAAGPATQARPLSEEDEPNPITAYGSSKLSGEVQLRDLAGKMDWFILRPSAVIGPRDWQFLPLFRGVAKLGLYPQFGSGQQLYSFISGLDIARALLIAGETDSPVNQTYFVCHRDPVDWKDASRMIASFAGRKVRCLTLPAGLIEIIGTVNDAISSISGKPALVGREKVREILTSGWVCSSEKITRDWSFECEYDLALTLRVTYDFYREIGKI
jgi:nucleoside-diphosphate-sugar epimerase